MNILSKRQLGRQINTCETGAWFWEYFGQKANFDLGVFGWSRTHLYIYIAKRSHLSPTPGIIHPQRWQSVSVPDPGTRGRGNAANFTHSGYCDSPEADVSFHSPIFWSFPLSFFFHFENKFSATWQFPKIGISKNENSVFPAKKKKKIIIIACRPVLAKS